MVTKTSDSSLLKTGSPVYAFAIDVVVALFVFPIELILKRIVRGKALPNVLEKKVETS